MTTSGLLIPVRTARSGDGAFVWPDRAVLATPEPDDFVPLERLARALKRDLGIRARIEPGAVGPAAVRVRRDRRIREPDAYRLVVDSEGLELFAATSAGAYHGLMTVRELVRLHGRTLPAVEIRDRPDFARRGVYLDCSRGKVPTVETLKILVELLASFKVNELQLYVENVFTFRRHPRIGRGYDPFTPRDLLEVREHGRKHHVRLVPSLASFGHLERVLGLPEYIGLAELPGHLELPGGTTLCPGDPRSLRLIADLYDEFLPLFDAVDFNACGDETWELGRGRSARRAARHGVGAVYVDFLQKLHRLCRRHGKRMNVWADILLNHPETIDLLPEDVVLLNWEYGARGPRIPRSREIAGAGRPLVVCPGTSGWQTHGTHLENAIENVRRFARTGRRWRAEGLLNTDWGDYGHRNPMGASVHGYAHGAAHAWHGRGVDDATFTETFARQVLGATDDRLAAAIRRLGAADDLAGASLYHALSDPLDGHRDGFRGIPRLSPVRVSRAYRRRPIEAASDAGCRELIAAHPDARALRGAGRGPTARWVVEDLLLAADLDRLAARRVLAGREVRTGTTRTRDLRRLAAETRRVATRFEERWLRRNRPSRLRDNLKLFASAAAECDGLAGAR